MHDNRKPVVSYYKGNDPTINMTGASSWTNQLTDINIITTKNLSDEFIGFCVGNKHRVYLHVIINGMGGTVLEPNIPTVKFMFAMLKKLVDAGFPQKQILVVIDPILSNDNGLKALEMLLRVFTEFKILRLRNVRFKMLTYKNVNDLKPKGNDYESEHIIKMSKKAYVGKYVVSNYNILKRPSTKQLMPYLVKNEFFDKEFFRLKKRYEGIISIDNYQEPLIGVRELMAFGYNNSWKNADGTMSKIIDYEGGNKYKPIVNNLGSKASVRCPNMCKLCPFKG